jgi:hypothetical protein
VLPEVVWEHEDMQAAAVRLQALDRARRRPACRELNG